MALIVDIVCMACGRNSQVTIGSGCASPQICNDCKKLENDCKRREHFHGLDGLTVEERLRKIEKWIYDYKPPINPMNIRY